ncbi:hypothetical protein ACWD3Z_16295 [Streptomyces sp. NPDC002740]
MRSFERSIGVLTVPRPAAAAGPGAAQQFARLTRLTRLALLTRELPGV